MNESVTLWHKPENDEIYMLAGWRQWADAGSISSGLPQYLINILKARRIGEIKSEGFYLFQFPGTHHLLRPEIKLEDGYRKALHKHRNEIYYAEQDGKGLVIFSGDEPHMAVDRYAEAFFEIARQLKARRVVSVAGVYGPMPYDKERSVSCVYSLRGMRQSLEKYVLRYSNYEGGVTIGSYLLDKAEAERIEYLGLTGFAPSYDFAPTAMRAQEIRVENDYKAWYDLMRRINHMFGMSIDLTELAEKSDDLIDVIDTKIAEFDADNPQLKARSYLDKIADEFEERPFIPLDDVWDREIGDLFKDLDD